MPGRPRDRRRSRSRSRSRSRERRRSRSPGRRRSPSHSPSRRGRSRSPRPEKKRRSRTPEWLDDADRREDARRAWSRSPVREKKKTEADPDEAKKAAAAAAYPEGSMEAMMAAMGLPVGFDSTKGTHVEGNDDIVVASSTSKRKFRQYMNKRLPKNEAFAHQGKPTRR